MSSFGGYDLTDPLQKQALLNELFSDPTLFPDAMKSWVPAWSEQNIQLPIDSIIGYRQFAATAATAILTEESTASTAVSAYGDLTTVGPTVSGLSDGAYVVSWGAGCMTSNSGIRAKMNISVDGAVPDDTKSPQAYTLSPNITGISSSFVFQLSGLRAGAGGHTLTCKYGMGATGAKGTWGSRWMTVHQVTGQ